MKTKLCLLLLLVTVMGKLEMKFQQTEALLYSNKQVVLKFVCVGGVGEYTYSFLDIPSGWKKNKNDLIISNFEVSRRQEWSFDIHVIDGDTNYLQQTVRVVFQGYRLQILGVTIPKTGNQREEASQRQISSKPKTSSFEDFNFKELIGQYPGLDKDDELQSLFGIDYDSNLDITPQIIASAQAKYDPARDARKITEYQVKRNAAFQRQLSADKAIANLLHIIQKITANVNEAKEEQIQLDKKFTEANLEVRNCNEEVYQMEDKKAKIKNAIKDRKTKLDQHNLEIQNIEVTIQQIKEELNLLVRQRLELEKFNAPQTRVLSRLEENLNTCQQNIVKEKEKTSEAAAEINQNKAEIDIIETDIEESNKRVRLLDNDLSLVKKRILELKRELAEAEEEEIVIEKEKKYFEELPSQGIRKIQTLQRRNSLLIRSMQNSTNTTSQKSKECDEIKNQIRGIREQINLSQFNYNTIGDIIEKKEGEIEQNEEKKETYEEDSRKLPVEVQILQGELNKYEERIRRQNYICAVAHQELILAEDRLNSAIKRYNENAQYLNKARNNLEKARAEKQLADLTVQEFLLTSTNASLYSYIPSEAIPNYSSFTSTTTRTTTTSNGKTTTTTTNTSNRSTSTNQSDIASAFPSLPSLFPSSFPQTSSPSSQIPDTFSEPEPKQSAPSPTLNTITSVGDNFSIVGYSKARDPAAIDSLSSYVQRNFGISGKFQASSNQVLLFPLDSVSYSKIVSPVSKTSGLAFFNCQNGNTKSFSGTLESVNFGSVVVRVNSRKYSLSISTCTTIASTQPDTFFQKGATVYFSGKSVFALPGTTLFNVHEILIIP